MAFDILTPIQESLGQFGFDLSVLVPQLVVAVVFLLVGLIAGKFLKWLLKKILISFLKLDELLKYGIIETMLTLVKWVVYLLFINAAINAVDIPGLSSYLTASLTVIQGIMASLVILVAGYAVARYLKNALQKTGVRDLQFLGILLWGFSIYISFALAVRSAFVGLEQLAEYVVIIATLALAYVMAKNYKELFTLPPVKTKRGKK
jgi:hypothetical protein